MICCKIIADYNNKDASFSKLCELLAKKGDWTWNGDAMFFADTEGEVDEKAVIRCVKKAGYKKVFVDVYDQHNEPHEDEAIKGWITDKVTKIYYIKFEQDNQRVLRETKKGLDEIEQEVNKIIIDLKQQQKESVTQKAEDDDNGRKD